MPLWLGGVKEEIVHLAFIVIITHVSDRPDQTNYSPRCPFCHAILTSDVQIVDTWRSLGMRGTDT
jgi:hypothetical protein